MEELNKYLSNLSEHHDMYVFWPSPSAELLWNYIVLICGFTQASNRTRIILCGSPGSNERIGMQGHVSYGFDILGLEIIPESTDSIYRILSQLDLFLPKPCPYWFGLLKLLGSPADAPVTSASHCSPFSYPGMFSGNQKSSQAVLYTSLLNR